jgi:hypothetical protein
MAGPDLVGGAGAGGDAGSGAGVAADPADGDGAAELLPFPSGTCPGSAMGDGVC